MPSVMGLLEQRELVARRRVEELREGADRVQAGLAAAERDWKQWAVARFAGGRGAGPGGRDGTDCWRADPGGVDDAGGGEGEVAGAGVV